MRSSSAVPLLLATAILTLGVLSGCQSAQTQSLSDTEVQSLLAEMRGSGDGPRSWQTLGHGSVLMREGTVRLLADDQGRFRFQVDDPVHYAEVHDGENTWKLYAWGSVLDLDGREEETTLIFMWVLTGYWLSPDAPLMISANASERQGDVVTLRVQHRDGQLPFEVLVDTERKVPIRVQAADVPPNYVLELDNHQTVNGVPVASSVRWVNRGMAIADLEFEIPSEMTTSEDTWSRPQTLTRVDFDRSAPTQLEARNDGRGYLFVRPVINGQQMGWFLFDTGAPATILGLEVVKKLGLAKVAEGQSGGVGGKAGIDLHAVDSIRVGPVTAGPVFAVSRDVMRLGWKNIPIEGILGCDVISHAVVEYDVRSGWIGLHDPATYELPSGVSWKPIILNEGKPIMRLAFEGHDGEFLVDTAAGVTFSIAKPLVDRLELLKDRETKKTTISGVGGSIGMRRGKVKWLDFGGTRYEDIATDFAVSDQGSYADPYPDGIVGISLIDDYRVVFDLTNKRMAFLDRMR